MRARLSAACMCLLLLTVSATNAAEPGERTTRNGAATEVNLDWQGPPTTPSAELLEFLGDWETRQGEWLGPQGVIDIELTEPVKEPDDETTNQK